MAEWWQENILPGFSGGEESDPSLGTNVVIAGQTQNFPQGVTPYNFLSAGYNYPGGMATVAEGSPEYRDLRDDARTRNQQGAVTIAALIGGGAALSGLGGAAGASGGGGAFSNLGSTGARTGASGLFRNLFSSGGGSMPGPFSGMGASGWLGLGTDILGSIQEQRQTRDIAGRLSTNLGEHQFEGPAGLRGFAGESGSGFDLGGMNSLLSGQGMFANQAMGRAGSAMFGLPGDVQAFGGALNRQPLNMGSFFGGEQGSQMLAQSALSDAFNPNNTMQSVYGRTLEQMRQQARPEEQRLMQSFSQNMFNTGRGAVTGAAGNEGSIGGGRLAAAFGQGLARADIDRQLAANEQGIATANASENLLSSIFSRFSNQANAATGFNTGAFNRQRGVLNEGYDRAVGEAVLPANVSAAFQNLVSSGVGNFGALTDIGTNLSTSALNTGLGAGQLRIGSGSNLASFLGNRSASPVLDAFSSFMAGRQRPTTPTTPPVS